MSYFEQNQGGVISMCFGQYISIHYVCPTSLLTIHIKATYRVQRLDAYIIAHLREEVGYQVPYFIMRKTACLTKRQHRHISMVVYLVSSHIIVPAHRERLLCVGST